MGAEVNQLSDIILPSPASSLEDREQSLNQTLRGLGHTFYDDGMSDSLLAKHVICNPYAKEKDDDFAGPGRDPSPNLPALSTLLPQPVSDPVIQNPVIRGVTPRRAGQEEHVSQPGHPTLRAQQDVQGCGEMPRSGFLSSWLKRRHPQPLHSDPIPDALLPKSLPSLWRRTTPKKMLSFAVARQGTSKHQEPVTDTSNSSTNCDSICTSPPSDVAIPDQDVEETAQSKSPCTFRDTDTVLQNQYFLEETAELLWGTAGGVLPEGGGPVPAMKGLFGQSSGHSGGGAPQPTDP